MNCKIIDLPNSKGKINFFVPKVCGDWVGIPFSRLMWFGCELANVRLEWAQLRESPNSLGDLDNDSVFAALNFFCEFLPLLDRDANASKGSGLVANQKFILTNIEIN
jgi:hypothetical protein